MNETINFMSILNRNSILAFLGGGLVLISLSSILSNNKTAKETKRREEILQLNFENAQLCIEKNGESEICDEVQEYMLEGNVLKQISKIKEKLRADYWKKREEEEKILEITRREEEAETKKLINEGWEWINNDFIYRICGGENAACDDSLINFDSNWKIVVWCKERACGNFFIAMEVIKDSQSVGYVSKESCGNEGEKVILDLHPKINGDYLRFSEFRSLQAPFVLDCEG
tara:strand:+ start:66 stop:755 length:690 start_codon:yes stop_codon:yes gene_type:complete